jgi:hypothetical protein
MDNKYIELFISCDTSEIQFLETCHRNGNVSLAIWFGSYTGLLECLPHYKEIFKDDITTEQLDTMDTLLDCRSSDMGPFIINVDVYDNIVRVYYGSGKPNILYGFDVDKLGNIIKLKTYIDDGAFIYTIHRTLDNVFIKKSTAIRSADFVRDESSEHAYEQIMRDDGQFYNYYSVDGFKAKLKIKDKK